MPKINLLMPYVATHILSGDITRTLNAVSHVAQITLQLEALVVT